MKKRYWISSVFPLALLISLFNTVIIVLFLVPHQIQNENKVFEQSQRTLPVVKNKLQDELHYNSQSAARQISKNSISTVQQRDETVPLIESKFDSQMFGLNSDAGTKNNVIQFAKNKTRDAEAEEFKEDFMQKQLKFDRGSMLMAGKPPKNPVELVIGIPTIKRASKEYLTSTLNQLVQYLNKNDTSNCHIVVLSAEFDQSHNLQLVDSIKKQFKDELESGLIQVIKPDAKFYPKFKNLPVLWKDSPERIKWRSKQCIDYALLFIYCKKFGKYYIQLEDDVLITKGYFNEMKQFIATRSATSKWSNLQFGSGGFIGMLFRTSDLTRLALFVKMYYWLYPVDILFRHFNDIHLYGNNVLDIYVPPLFRHLGAESSLKGQTRKIVLESKEKIKTNHRLYIDATNPLALITTNIEVSANFAVDGPYRKTNLWYFWGKNLKLSDFVLITFKKELTLLQVVIDSGAEFAPEDKISGGKLLITGIGKDGNCDVDSYRLLNTTLTNGKVLSSTPSGIPGVKCLLFILTKLTYKNKRPSWLLIREIAVWSK